MSRDTNPFAILSVFFLGTIMGGIGALILGTDERGEIKPKVKTKIKYAKQSLSAGEDWVSYKAHEAAGEVTDALTKAKSQLKAKVEELGAKFGKVDKSKYAKAVGEVISTMKSVGEVTSEQAKVVRKYLLDDYQTVATAIMKPARKK